MTWARKIIKLLLVVVSIMFQLDAAGQNYVSKNVRLALFSSTPLEDIRAASDKGIVVLASKTREIVVQVPINTFEFDKRLMQEHFNENYMESDKYPLARFKGVIDQAVNFDKDGSYTITVSGLLSVHGVDKKRTIPGKVTIRNGNVQIYTQFKVACADHRIKIPTLMFAKIAEVIDIRVDGMLNQLK